MPVPSNISTGKLVLQGLPDLTCFNSMQELIAALPNLLGVEIPSSVTNVIVSNVQPTDSQTTALWIRLSNSGSFIGLYVFSQGQWVPIFPPSNDVNVALIRFVGDSRDIPAGYALGNGSNPDIPPGAVAAIMAQWIFDPTNSYYILYDATFVGF